MFPTEIEWDIQHFWPGRSIKEFWRTLFGVSNEMTARELWVFLEHVPDVEHSAYRTALRDGDWTEREYVQALIATQLAFLRYDQAALGGQKMRKPEPLLSPKERREKAETNEFARGVHDLLLSHMRGENVAPKREGIEFFVDKDPVKAIRERGEHRG